MPIEDTAETMFRKPNIHNLVSIYRETMNIFTIFRNEKPKPDLTASKYNWTGQHTDIAFVDESGSLNISEINNIQDSDLRQNVYQTYNSAVKDGYLKYNKATQNFSLSDNGKNHINSDAFKVQFEKDQSQKISQNKAQIQLSGNPSDLNAFRYTNSIDLNHLLYDDPAKFKRILNYFNVCEKYNFVKINNGIITATDKCKEYLSQNPEENFNISKISPDFVKQTINRELAKKAVQGSIKAATPVGNGVTAIIELTASGAKKLIDHKSTPVIYNH